MLTSLNAITVYGRFPQKKWAEAGRQQEFGGCQMPGSDYTLFLYVIVVSVLNKVIIVINSWLIIALLFTGRTYVIHTHSFHEENCGFGQKWTLWGAVQWAAKMRTLFFMEIDWLNDWLIFSTVLNNIDNGKLSSISTSLLLWSDYLLKTKRCSVHKYKVS